VIDSVDAFVIYDDVQYSTGSWRNRNRVKNSRGLHWITVPVRSHLGQVIDEVRIGKPHKPWRDEHRRLLHDALGPAPHSGDAIRLWEDGVRADVEHLSALNFRLLRAVCEYLCIKTPLVTSRQYAVEGSQTERLVNLLRKIGATNYLSGPSAKVYIDEALFREAGIGLEYKSYNYAPYPQLWGAFENAVTVLDLIANCGPASRRFLKSLTPDGVAIPPADPFAPH
jgi:hypothetical protein